MKKHTKIFINYRFTCLNKYINAERANKFKAARIKKKETSIAAQYFVSVKKRIHAMKKPLKIKFTWIEPNMRKDLDNISFSKKFIIDGLVECRCIKNDGQNYINSFDKDNVFVDKKNVGVWVEIIEN